MATRTAMPRESKIGHNNILLGKKKVELGIELATFF
jgi:hypothetical protein